MAIVRSIAMGNSRKSAGNVTFRTVRGRLVASQKIAANPNYVPSALQVAQRANFGKVFGWARSGGSIVRYLFGATKYGNSFNQLIKRNWEFIKNQTFTDSELSSVATNSFKWMLQLITSFAVTGTATKAMYAAFGRSTAVALESPSAIIAEAAEGDDLIKLTANYKVYALPDQKVVGTLVTSVGLVSNVEGASDLAFSPATEFTWDDAQNCFTGEIRSAMHLTGVTAEHSVIYIPSILVDGVPATLSAYTSVDNAKNNHGACGIINVSVS